MISKHHDYLEVTIGEFKPIERGQNEVPGLIQLSLCLSF